MSAEKNKLDSATQTEALSKNQNPVSGDIYVQDVHKYFGVTKALNGVNFSANFGEIHAIVGGNGCGKSTLFSMCICEQSPDNGKIILKNKSIEQIPIHLRAKEGLGYLPQQRSVFDMSVYDNILGVAQLSIKGVDNQKSITEKLLDEFNLKHLKTRKHTLIIFKKFKNLFPILLSPCTLS